MEDKRFCTEW